MYRLDFHTFQRPFNGFFSFQIGFYHESGAFIVHELNMMCPNAVYQHMIQ